MNTPQAIWNTLWPVLSTRYKRTATFLDYHNTWELLVAVILSAQTTDDMVNRITPALFKKFKTPKQLATASVKEVLPYIRRINYYNAKTRYIIETAKLVVNRFNSVVPDDPVLLQTLPGVGRKTAVAVLANGFQKYVGIAVDTHVIRFAQRFRLSDKKTPEGIEQDLLAIIPRRHWNAASYAIKEYGRREGKARGYRADHDPLVQALWKQGHAMSHLHG